MKHGSVYPKRALYPVGRIPAARKRAIERAVSEAVKKTKPRSLCICGEFCAMHHKLERAYVQVSEKTRRKGKQ